jgi:type I restriction enzyme S subunit
MSRWQVCKLGDVLTLQRGFDLPNGSRRPGGVPVVSSAGVTGLHDEARAKGPGVVIGRYGTLGDVHYITGDYWPLNTTLWVKDFKSNDPLFCAYLLKTLNIAETSGAAAVPGVNRNVLHSLPVTCPPLDAQRRIASILGAYDDLIDVNKRRVAVLEEMARGLFEEWFVRFRFPGQETVSVVDMPDGPLPEGWARAQARDLIDFDPRTRVPTDGLKPFIPMGHLNTETSLIASPEAREGNSGAKFQNGDTLFARITPCLENGKTGLVRGLASAGGVGFGSTEFIVMRGSRAGPAFTYCLSRLPAFRDHARSSMSGASGRQRARSSSVAAFVIAVPPTDRLLEEFERLAWPMLDMVGLLGDATRCLAASRDLLLPRLISGQLSVEAAERELEEAA